MLAGGAAAIVLVDRATAKSKKKSSPLITMEAIMQ